MYGMILAAGRGMRMRELTLSTPKPLVRVGNYYLIEYALNSFIQAGITNIVINVCYLGDQIKRALGEGKRYGVNITYSSEKKALETGGGIVKALPFLGKDAFVVLSADVITDYPLQKLYEKRSSLAHLVLVDNPIYHPKGDFALINGRVSLNKSGALTFANLGWYQPALFANCERREFRLADVLGQAIQDNEVSGEYFKGLWYNIGSPEDRDAVTKLPSMAF